MKDYHKLENELFARWEAKWNSEDPKIQKLHRLEGGDYCKSSEVVPDGMMYRGEISFFQDKDGKNYSDREPGDEYERWEKAPLRLIMLTKDNINDVDDKSSWDKRLEIACNNKEAYEKCRTTHPNFYKNYIRWIYCMLTPEMKKGRWIVKTFDEANDFSLSMKYMIHEAPLVRMNVKKQVGSSKIHSYILKWFIDAYEDEIVDQIRIYNANILFCCEKEGHIKNLIESRMLLDLKNVNDYMFYSSSERVLVVNFFHPSYHWKNDEDLYVTLQKAYKDFLQRYPDFPFGK